MREASCAANASVTPSSSNVAISLLIRPDKVKSNNANKKPWKLFDDHFSPSRLSIGSGLLFIMHERFSERILQMQAVRIQLGVIGQSVNIIVKEFARLEKQDAKSKTRAMLLMRREASCLYKMRVRLSVMCDSR